MRMRTHVLTALSVLTPWPAATAEGFWERLESSVFGARYDDIHFIDPEVGWAVNAFGEVWHTDDGGDTWQLQLVVDAYLRSGAFADAQQGWVGALDSVSPLYHSNDGGETWATVVNLPVPRPSGICGIDVVNEDVIVATGVYAGPACFLKSIDGGATWTGTTFLPTTAVGLIDVRFTSPTDGIVVGGVGASLFEGNAVVLATDDGGTTWAQRFVGTVPQSWCWKISFPTTEIGYISIERMDDPHYFLKTTDGGDTWTENPIDTSERSQGIGFVTEEIGWIGASFGANGASVTIDGGATWSVDTIGFALNRFQFFGTSLGYAAGDFLYRYTDEPVGIADAAPRSRIQVRTFPNPFRPVTTIAFSLPEPAAVHVFVTDPGGRLVRTLHDGDAGAGDHELVWDGRNDVGEELAPGVYLYVIHSVDMNAMGKLVKVD